MKQIITFYIILILLFIPAMLLAGNEDNCSKATRLVILAYDMGHDPSVYADQIKLLNHALDLCPDHADAHNNLASIFEMQKDYKQALYHYTSALESRPDFTDAWFGLGEVYYKTGQYPLALEAYLKCCKDKEAYKRIEFLLHQQQYRSGEQGNVLKKESLLLLFDENKREQIRNLMADCGIKADIAREFIFRNIRFDLGSASLKSESMNQIHEIGSALGQIGNVTVIIKGHTDKQPFKNVSPDASSRMNMQLSKDRADTVAQELAKMGIALKRVQTYGYGPAEPIVDEDSKDAYARNRRVEVRVE